MFINVVQDIVIATNCGCSKLIEALQDGIPNKSSFHQNRNKFQNRDSSNHVKQIFVTLP